MRRTPLRATVAVLFLLSFLFPWTLQFSPSSPFPEIGRSFILADAQRCDFLQILEYAVLTLALYLCWDD